MHIIQTHTRTHSNRMNIAHIEEHSNNMPKTMSVWNTTILWLTDFIFLSLSLTSLFILFLSISHPLSPLNRFQFSWFRFTRARHVFRMDCVKIVGSHAQKILNCKVNESKEMYNFRSAPQCFKKGIFIGAVSLLFIALFKQWTNRIEFLGSHFDKSFPFVVFVCYYCCCCFFYSSWNSCLTMEKSGFFLLFLLCCL